MLENPVQECFIDHDMMTVRILYYAKGDFCCLLKASINSLVPDQDRQNVGPGLGPNRLTFG